AGVGLPTPALEPAFDNSWGRSVPCGLMVTGRGAGSGKTPPRRWVLVVDDNARLRALWIEVLEEAGYRAIGSEDGLAAAELIRDLFPDLILLDLRMPRASGWDFLENLRANSRWHTIPVVIVSVHLDEGR